MADVAAAALKKTLNYDSILSLRILPLLEAVLGSPQYLHLNKGNNPLLSNKVVLCSYFLTNLPPQHNHKT